MRKLLKAALVVAMTVPGIASAAATIVGGPHDLSINGQSGQAYSSAEKEICKFCHTPHRAKSDSMALWNRQDGVAQSFNWALQGRKTNYGTDLPDNVALGLPSMRCMSCHDGVTALGATVRGEAIDLNVALSGNGDIAAAVDSDGLDLSGNHPVTVTYPNTVNGTYLGRAVSTRFTVEPGLVDEDFVPFGAVVGAKIYGADDNNPGVECGSCHDPHGAADTDGEQIRMFLRVTTDESKICVACHLK